MSSFKREFKKICAEKLWSINQELKKLSAKKILSDIEMLLWGEKNRADLNEWKLQELVNKEKEDRSTKPSKTKYEKNPHRPIYYKAYKELQIKFNKETIPKKVVVNYLIDNYKDHEWHRRSVNDYHKEARAKFKLS